MKKCILIYIAIAFLIMTELMGQPNLAIGEWKSYLPHTIGSYVTESDDRVFYVANQTLTRFNKSDLEQEYISTIDG